MNSRLKKQKKVNGNVSDGKYVVRIYAVAFVVLMFGCVVVYRLASVQLFSSYKYQTLWHKQSEKRLILPARRGSVFDRNGERLVYSLQKPIALNVLDSVASDTSSIMPSVSWHGRVKYRKTRRVYKFGSLAGQVLGFTGRDGYGLAGVEYALDDILRGRPGWAIVGRDGRRRKYPIQSTPKVMPEDGLNLKLTIDATVQSITEKALERGVKKTQSKRGMAIVMDPKTGEILAMASYPSFNPNKVGAYSNGDWKNYCISFSYEPGSTFKVVTASSAIEDNLMSEKDSIDGNQGVFKIWGETIHDSEPHGMLSFREALAYSSNVCFAKIADKVGKRGLYKYSRAFGFGTATGIKLPGEEDGILHSVNEWSGLTLFTMAMGHEVSGTLLQSICSFATIANNGLYVQPRIIKSVFDYNGKVVRDYKPVTIRRVISRKTSKRMCRNLEDVVRYGTGRRAAIKGLSVAGKTGTSQKIGGKGRTYVRNLVVASFIGFVPSDNPKLVCAVSMDEPQNNRYGGSAAAPVFKEIISSIVYTPQLSYAQEIVSVTQDDNSVSAYSHMPDFLGLKGKDVKHLASVEGFKKIKIIGSGDFVVDQIPDKGILLPYSYVPVLFMNNKHGFKNREYSVIGRSAKEALEQLNYMGINVKFKGYGGVVVKQTRIDNNSVECVLEYDFDNAEVSL